MKKLSKKSLIPSLRRLLRPVVWLCLRSSLKVQDLLDLVKSAFIEEAAEQLTKSGHEVNVSRLSVITGLQRKDITRLMKGAEGEREDIDLLSRLIFQWQHHKEYSIKGKPRPLSFEGGASEFAELVRSISTDLNPYTVLFELERTGQVEKEGKSVRLRSGIYELAGAERYPEALELVGRDWGDLLKAVEENIAGTEIPHLHLRTEFDNISIEALPQIREWLLDKGTTLHEEARAYLAQFDKDVNPRLFKDKGGARVSLSAFSLTQSAKENEK